VRCSSRSLKGFLSASVPVAFGLASFLALLFAYSKIFYTNFLPGNELLESVIRYVVAGLLLIAWLYSWILVIRWWKFFLIRKSPY